MQRSIIKYCAEHERYKCGYCKSPNTNYSHGLWAHTLSVSDYQDLIDRGWRRSGKYCYKPTMDMTCCPMYTIRCSATEFKASKSQKKTLKRMNKFLMGQDNLDHKMEGARKMSTSSSADANDEGCSEGREQFEECKLKNIDFELSEIIKASSNDATIEETGGIPGIGAPSAGTQNQPTNYDINSGIPKEVRKASGPDPNRSQIKKAKILRLERRLEKMIKKGIDINNLKKDTKNKEKQIEDFINELPENMKRKLQLKLVRTAPPSSEWSATADLSYNLYVKYQVHVHNDAPEDCSRSSFKNFLVESPLLEEYTDDGPPQGYGSFHQQYWLDDKLIGVGVIDILPKCVSSVYFFYDPEYMNLTLGTYGALREIAFTRRLSAICPAIKYYYMGFYVHSCQKMRYKGKFNPSDLLCPETYKWFPLKECIPKLEEKPYSRLDSDIDSIDTNNPTSNDIDNIPLWKHGRIILYKNCKTNIYDELFEYAQLVGAKSAKRLFWVV